MKDERGEITKAPSLNITDWELVFVQGVRRIQTPIVLDLFAHNDNATVQVVLRERLYCVTV